MGGIPRKRQVNQAIRAVSREVKLAIKEANQQAAKRLGRGDYNGAQSIIETAKAIGEFGAEIKTIQNRWRSFRSAGGKAGQKKGETTALWEYYRPILKALVALDGDATRREIESKMEETIGSVVKEGDLVANGRGVPRWKVMVGRAKKHMIAEGFVSGENMLRWKITSKGEQAAKGGVKAR